MYSHTEYKQEKMARALLRDASISFKSSIMLANSLRGMMSDRAERMLEGVAENRVPIRFTRFRDGAGHRPGIGPGKYPVKAAVSFLTLLRQGVSNAENKGLGVPLKIAHIAAQEGSRPLHSGSRRSRLMKRTSVELVLEETEESKRRQKRESKKGTTSPQVSSQQKGEGSPASTEPAVQVKQKTVATKDKGPDAKKSLQSSEKRSSHPKKEGKSAQEVRKGGD